MAMPVKDDENIYITNVALASMLSCDSVAYRLEKSGRIGKAVLIGGYASFPRSRVASFLEERFAQSQKDGFFYGYDLRDLVDMAFKEGLVGTGQLAQPFRESYNAVRSWVYGGRLSSIDMSMTGRQRRLHRMIPSIARRESEPLLQNLKRLHDRAEGRRRTEERFERLKGQLSDDTGISNERIGEYLRMIGKEDITDGQMPHLMDLILTDLYPHTFITPGEIRRLSRKYRRSRQRVHQLVKQGRVYAVNLNGRTYVSRESWFQLVDSPSRPTGRPRKKQNT